MNHARRVLKQELAILLDTRRQVIADRSLPDRSTMLAEITREISELRDAISVIEGVIPAGFVRRPDEWRSLPA